MQAGEAVQLQSLQCLQPEAVTSRCTVQAVVSTLASMLAGSQCCGQAQGVWLQPW